ncbi:hypothetical protein MRX96_047539 [Rhipicephalus microplus]
MATRYESMAFPRVCCSRLLSAALIAPRSGQLTSKGVDTYCVTIFTLLTPFGDAPTNALVIAEKRSKGRAVAGRKILTLLLPRVGNNPSGGFILLSGDFFAEDHLLERHPRSVSLGRPS